jgi:hypothetical protein
MLIGTGFLKWSTTKIDSHPFQSGGFLWNLSAQRKEDHLALFLQRGQDDGTSKSIVLEASFTLSVVNLKDPSKSKVLTSSSERKFKDQGSWGWDTFMPLKTIEEEGFLVDGTLALRVEIRSIIAGLEETIKKINGKLHNYDSHKFKNGAFHIRQQSKDGGQTGLYLCVKDCYEAEVKFSFSMNGIRRDAEFKNGTGIGWSNFADIPSEGLKLTVEIEKFEVEKEVTRNLQALLCWGVKMRSGYHNDGLTISCDSLAEGWCVDVDVSTGTVEEVNKEDSKREPHWTDTSVALTGGYSYYDHEKKVDFKKNSTLNLVRATKDVSVCYRSSQKSDGLLLRKVDFADGYLSAQSEGKLSTERVETTLKEHEGMLKKKETQLKAAREGIVCYMTDVSNQAPTNLAALSSSTQGGGGKKKKQTPTSHRSNSTQCKKGGNGVCVLRLLNVLPTNDPLLCEMLKAHKSCKEPCPTLADLGAAYNKMHGKSFKSSYKGGIKSYIQTNSSASTVFELCENPSAQEAATRAIDDAIAHYSSTDATPATFPEALDKLVQHLQITSILSVAEVFKGGSWGKGTQVGDKSDADLILSLNDLPEVAHSTWMPLLLQLCKAVLEQLPGVQIIKCTRHAVQLLFDGMEVDVLPVPHKLFALSKEERAKTLRDADDNTLPYLSAACAKAQVGFVKAATANAGLTGLIRLVKRWVKRSPWKKAPNKFCLELMLIEAWKKCGEAKGPCLKLFWEMCRAPSTLRIVWGDDPAKEIANGKPLVQDPGNYRNNVATWCDFEELQQIMGEWESFREGVCYKTMI